MQDVQHFRTIEDCCCAECIQDTNICVDEESDQYRQGSHHADKIICKINAFNAKNVSVKEVMLPLQGESLWQSWAQKDKELYRQFYRGSMNVNDYSAHIKSEKKEIRKLQLKRVKSLTPVMKSFITSLLELAGPSNKTVRDYFLHCLKLRLDNISRERISALQHKYQVVRKQLHDAQKQVANNGSNRETSAKRTTSNLETDRLTKEMDLLQKDIVNSSFGLEHLFREAGQVYEVSQQLSREHREFSQLPGTVAELLIEGYPLELMDGDAAHVPKLWVSAIMKEVTQKLCDPNVYVLSVLGLQSTGKSTMLNTTFGLQFNVSAGRCTRGAFMQLLPLDKKLEEEAKCNYLLVIDTEGVRAPELDTNKKTKHDNELATFAIGLADTTLINIYGEVPGEMDEILQTSVLAFLRMHQVRLNPSCQFVYQNAGASIKSQLGRIEFSKNLNKFTIEAAEIEKCVGQYESFNDVIRFDDQTDVHFFPGLWKGVPPMAPVEEGYSMAAQRIKHHIVTEMIDRTSKPTSFGRKVCYDLSSLQRKFEDLWKALLQEDFVFSFKSTLEITAYNSLETEFGKWEWSFQESMLQWEVDVENEITVAVNVKRIPSLVQRRCSELDKYVTEKLCKPLVTKMDDFIRSHKQSEILAQWKGGFQTKLENLSQKLKEHAYNKCRQLGKSKEAMSNVEMKQKQYSDMITQKVQDLIANLKEEQEALERNLDQGKVNNHQLTKVLKQDLFTPEKLERYKRQGILTEEEVHKISTMVASCGHKLNHRQLRKILVGDLLSTDEVKKILKQGKATENDLKLQFDKEWKNIMDTTPFVQHEPVNVKDAVEKTLMEFKRAYGSLIIVALQNKHAETTLELRVEKCHYDDLSLKRTRWTNIDWVNRWLAVTDPCITEVQRVTDYILEVSRDCLKKTCEKGTDFSEAYTLELLHLLDQTITEQSAKYKDVFVFQPQYIADIFVTVCHFAVGEFHKMAKSFREKHDPRLYLETHMKGPLFTKFKNQYYQTEAEEAIANTLCAHLEEPIQGQVRMVIGGKIVGQMRHSEDYFVSKAALKFKILTDLHDKDDLDRYMLYLKDVKRSFKEWIRFYTVQYCDMEMPGGDTRLQAAIKEEISRLIGLVEKEVNEINESNVREWLTTLCSDSDIQRKLGVRIEVNDLISGHEMIQELNLENFKCQIKCGLQDLKKNLHSLVEDVKCETEMLNWKDKPYDLLNTLVGCTEQCPFCGEQCDFLDPDHDVNVLKHRVETHRPSCLAGWRDHHSQVLHTNFCPTDVAGKGKFYKHPSDDESHPYKEYQKIYPHWSIDPDPTAQDSLYWMSFVSKYNEALAEQYHAKPAKIPKQWAEIEWEDVQENLKKQYNL